MKSMVERPRSLPLLEGSRVRLRAMHDGDAGALLAIYGDPMVMRHTDEPPFPGLETVRRMLGSVRRLLLDGSSLEWAVVLKDSNALVGTCGLHGFDDEAGAAEVGCLLLRAAWGQGLMAEAIGLMTEYARDELRLRRLEADVAPDNVEAQRLFARLGYVRARPDLWTIDLPAP